MADRIVQG